MTNEFARIERLRKLSSLLDNSFRIPGTSITFGIDSLIGIVPGIGDVFGLMLSGYIIHEAKEIGIPKATLVRMAVNVAIDSLVGSIPVLGDIFDVAYKSNIKNMRLIEAAIAKRDAAGPVIEVLPASGNKPKLVILR